MAGDGVSDVSWPDRPEEVRCWICGGSFEPIGFNKIPKHLINGEGRCPGTGMRPSETERVYELVRGRLATGAGGSA